MRLAVVCEDDESLRIELIGKFLADAEPMVAKLTELVGYYEVRAVNQLAQALTSLAGNAGAVELRDAALRLEAASAQTCTPTSSILKAEMSSILRTLECIRSVRRSWWSRAIDRAEALRRGRPTVTTIGS
jgi:HPt (histidine-containing phosphotransfer) domain-containing protein